MVDRALSQVIDYQLEERSSVELACAYRAICGTMILRTALCCSAKQSARRDENDNRDAAQRWIRTDRGVIRFSDACDALDVDPDVIRSGIARYAEQTKDPTIRKSRKPKAHYVFGRSAKSLAEARPISAINTEASGDGRHGSGL